MFPLRTSPMVRMQKNRPQALFFFSSGGRSCAISSHPCEEGNRARVLKIKKEKKNFAPQTLVFLPSRAMQVSYSFRAGSFPCACNTDPSRYFSHRFPPSDGGVCFLCPMFFVFLTGTMHRTHGCTMQEMCMLTDESGTVTHGTTGSLSSGMHASDNNNNNKKNSPAMMHKCTVQYKYCTYPIYRWAIVQERRRGRRKSRGMHVPANRVH